MIPGRQISVWNEIKKTANPKSQIRRFLLSKKGLSEIADEGYFRFLLYGVKSFDTVINVR